MPGVLYCLQNQVQNSPGFKALHNIAPSYLSSLLPPGSLQHVLFNLATLASWLILELNISGLWAFSLAVSRAGTLSA